MADILEYTTVHLQRNDLQDRVRLETPTHPALRSPGVHLSNILRFLVLESGMIRYQEQLEEMDLPLRMAMGLAWEEFCVSLYSDILWQPGEISTDDGIYMTCDGLARSNDHIRVEEFKLSWRKSKTADEILADEWYWCHQLRGYCLGYNAREVRLHACWVNGDYRGSGPIYNRYRFRFSDKEIETTRTMLVANMQRAIEKGYAE